MPQAPRGPGRMCHMTELRPYQREIVAKYANARAAGHNRILLVAPTGAGKTVIASAIIKTAVAGRGRVLVLAHRREIITQTSAKLHSLGISYGIIQAGLSPRPMEWVQVASVQTLWQRAVRTATMQLPLANLLVIDEC